MSLPYGESDVRCYLKTEATFGTFDAAANGYGLPWDSVTPTFTPSLAKFKGIGSHYLNALRRGMHRGDLSTSWRVPATAEALLADLDLLKSRSIEVVYFSPNWATPSSVISLLFKGAMASRWVFEGKATDRPDESALLKHTVDWVAQQLTVSNAKQSNVGTYLDTYAAAEKRFYDTYIKKASTELTECTGFKVVFDYNLKAIPVIRSSSGYLMKYLKALRKMCEVDLDFEFESKASFDDVVGDVASNWEIGLGSAGKALTFTSCKFDVVSCSAPRGDIIYCHGKLHPLSVSVVV